MRFGLLLLFLSFHLTEGICQHSSLTQSIAIKPPLDTSALRTWPSLGYASISPNGNYVQYAVYNEPEGNRSLVIANIRNGWKRELRFTKDPAPTAFFTNDSKQAYFKHGDTLCFLTLGSDRVDYIVGISAWHPLKGGDWVVYRQKSMGKDLILINLTTGFKQQLRNVYHFSSSQSGEVLLLTTRIVSEANHITTLQWMNLSNTELKTIWVDTVPVGRNVTISTHQFDNKEIQLAFSVQRLNVKQSATDSENNIFRNDHSVWYYKKGMEQAIQILNDESKGIDSGFFIAEKFLKFNKSGKYLFFQLQPAKDTCKLNPDAVSLDVWHYKDKVLQSQQLADGPQSRNYLAMVDLTNNQVLRLENENESAFLNGATDFVVIRDKKYKGDEYWLNDYSEGSYFLLSLKDNKRLYLTKERSLLSISFFIQYSPDGKYIVWFDPYTNNFYSYDIIRKRHYNISKYVSRRLTNEYNDLPFPSKPVGIAGWLEDKCDVLVYDNYDIWQLSLSCSHAPINITRGYGEQHRIKFRLLENEPLRSISSERPLLLVAFNSITKYNGFYQVLIKDSSLKMLSMKPSNFYIKDSHLPSLGHYWLNNNMRPVKAEGADVWILQRRSPTDALNYYWTVDFKTFHRITDLQPQKKYNWMSTELVTWRLPNGSLNQGILYKPEDFDSKKSYPLIFHYYEMRSYGLYDFPEPKISGDEINIPWLVSHGYLVFSPDIRFTVGHPGKSAHDVIVSAAKYLCKRSYVNFKKLGLHGFSWGGFETNYLITHTKLFAAAVEGAGASDLISGYNAIRERDNGSPYQDTYEYNQTRMGSTLWKRPDIYFENSPVLRASKVTTPLLMMHNKNDGSVNFSQAVELFTALRRLRKKVWLLQYDGETHQLLNPKNQVDYTVRVTQFFDYYLKDALPPKWMTEGIPAFRKQITTGLELESSGNKP